MRPGSDPPSLRRAIRSGVSNRGLVWPGCGNAGATQAESYKCRARTETRASWPRLCRDHRPLQLRAVGTLGNDIEALGGHPLRRAHDPISADTRVIDCPARMPIRPPIDELFTMATLSCLRIWSNSYSIQSHTLRRLIAFTRSNSSLVAPAVSTARLCTPVLLNAASAGPIHRYRPAPRQHLPQRIRKSLCKLWRQKVWLPGMDSNHELDRILKSRNLLILQSR
jgi:hypothetical protein